jgi:hypothetical protein
MPAPRTPAVTTGLRCCSGPRTTSEARREGANPVRQRGQPAGMLPRPGHDVASQIQCRNGLPTPWPAGHDVPAARTRRGRPDPMSRRAADAVASPPRCSQRPGHGVASPIQCCNDLPTPTACPAPPDPGRPRCQKATRHRGRPGNTRFPCCQKATRNGPPSVDPTLFALPFGNVVVIARAFHGRCWRSGAPMGAFDGSADP